MSVVSKNDLKQKFYRGKYSIKGDYTEDVQILLIKYFLCYIKKIPSMENLLENSFGFYRPWASQKSLSFCLTIQFLKLPLEFRCVAKNGDF